MGLPTTHAHATRPRAAHSERRDYEGVHQLLSIAVLRATLRGRREQNVACEPGAALDPAASTTVTCPQCGVQIKLDDVEITITTAS